jgi:hypothetical protein
MSEGAVLSYYIFVSSRTATIFLPPQAGCRTKCRAG